MVAALAVEDIPAAAADSQAKGDIMEQTYKGKATILGRAKGIIIVSSLLVMILFAVPPVHGKNVSQKIFSSPAKAADALVLALSGGTKNDLVAIFGSSSAEIISSGNDGADRSAKERFLQNYRDGHTIEYTGKNRAILIMGKDNWSFPVPLVKNKKGWIFDTGAGKVEIANRRIGRNELAVTGIMKGYVDAQHAYFRKDWDDDSTYEYAQRISSSEGKQDGLYWDPKPGEEKSPFGPLIAKAAEEKNTTEAGKPGPQSYRGYYFRVLTGQGKNAPGGAYDYIVKDRMIFGFALLAYPAVYGISGIHSFIVNQDGRIFEKNLGKNTDQQVRTIDRYNPDSSWKEVKLP